MDRREYITVPDITEFSQFTLDTQREVQARYEIARALAALATPSQASSRYWDTSQTKRLNLANDGVNVTLYRPNSKHLLTIDLASQGSADYNSTLHLGWRNLMDPHGDYESEVRGQRSSNDDLWCAEFESYMQRHRTDPFISGTFYDRIRQKTYLGFALGGQGYPQSADYLLADKRLCHGAFEDVLNKDVLPFVERGRSLFDSITSGTIFARNSLPVAAHTVGHPL
jgi:hypothetical protein